MAWVKTVEPDQATGLLRGQYERTCKGLGVGEYPNLVKAWSLQPEVAQAWLDLGHLAQAKAGLDERQQELLLTRITYLLKCAYVTTNHAWILRKQGVYSTEEVISTIHDWRKSALGARDKAMLAFGDKMALRSHDIDQADTDSLRKVGFSEEQITALIFLIGWLVTDAIIPNGLGPEPDSYSKDMRRVVDWR